MSDVIVLLPDVIANQIAAGEVIQRPASVVKELLENSVDAGSTKIELIIKDSGRQLIQVVDNGKGMSYTDARLCFERHATSKIKTADDLFALKTMGFRGEALASIAAVAQVEMRTKLESQNVGTLIKNEGSEIKVQEPCSCPTGTSIAVRNLFYNVPARRNFLKSNTVELKHIIDEFLHVALAHPDIHFSLFNEQEETFHLRPGSLKQRIVSVFGKAYNEKLIAIEENTDYVSINGFVCKPDSVKKTRGEQYFFLNNRYIRSSYLQHAVVTAYDKLIPENSFPTFVIMIEIDPSKVDINVHPTKQEVKFEDERSLYQIIKAAVKHALAQFAVVPIIDFENATTLRDFRNFNPSPAEQKSFPSEKDDYSDSFRNKQSEAWRDLNELDMETENRIFTVKSRWDASETIQPESKPLFQEQEEENRALFQLHNKYILTQIKTGFILVNQYHAHKRILFERYIDAMHDSPLPSQKLIFPKTLELNKQDFLLIKSLIPDLNKLGFEIEEFGSSGIIIHGFPAHIENTDEKELFEKMLEQFKLTSDFRHDENVDSLAVIVARMSAIPNGRSLDKTSMQRLIDELFACKQPNITPEGQPVFIKYHLEELEKHFK